MKLYQNTNGDLLVVGEKNVYGITPQHYGYQLIMYLGGEFAQLQPLEGVKLTIVKNYKDVDKFHRENTLLDSIRISKLEAKLNKLMKE